MGASPKRVLRTVISTSMLSSNKGREKMNHNYLREYLYIDQLEINSLLAQFNKGLKTNESKTEGSNNSASKSHTLSGESKTAGKVGLPFLAEATENITVGSDKTTQSSVGSNSSNSLTIIPSDYSVEMLENYMQVNNLVSDLKNAEIGSFIKLNENFKLINFNMIKNMTSPTHATNTLSLGIHELPEVVNDGKKILQEIQQMREQDKASGGTHQEELSKMYDSFSDVLNRNIEIWNSKVNSFVESSRKFFSITNSFASFASSIFPNTVLIYDSDYIVYAELDHFRMNEAQLQMLQNNRRKVNILGIVENISKETNTFKDQNIPDIKWEKITDTTFGLSNVILRKAGILHDGMLIIKPLALYFS